MLYVFRKFEFHVFMLRDLPGSCPVVGLSFLERFDRDILKHMKMPPVVATRFAHTRNSITRKHKHQTRQKHKHMKISSSYLSHT